MRQVYVLHMPFSHPHSTNASPGHYRLWVKGIRHGDISLHNLMYDVSETGDPVGILNDFDLASWIGYSTTNNDRTGTIPFMAIDLLKGGLEARLPRLYRHDLESFCWVLAYTTVAKIDYKDCTIRISPRSGVDAWFNDGSKTERRLHILSKRFFYFEYGKEQGVHARYYSYLRAVRSITRQWSDFHESRVPEEEPDGPFTIPAQEKPVSEQEVDEPARSLQLLITAVGAAGIGEEVAEMRTSLLEAIEIPL